MSDTKPTTSRQAKRPRPGSPVKFANPKMSYAETQDRLAKAIGTQDRDLLGTFINQVVAVAELGEPSDDLEVTFSVSVIEDILSNHSNGGVAKAMLAQYTAVHAMIMTLARRFLPHRCRARTVVRCSRARVAVRRRGQDGPVGHLRYAENDVVECTAAPRARALRLVTETRYGMERTLARLLRNIGNCVH
jgi:hypothetical protein